jgi:lysozyme
MGVICVDLSKYQAGFSFGDFAEAGGLGVILKASEGTTIKDSSYKTFRVEALAAGLKVASYHFFRSSDPVEQAEWYLKCATPDQGERVVCDVEDNTVEKGSVTNFLKHIRQTRPDLQLTVYTGHVGEEAEAQWGRFEWLAENTSLWTCQYSLSPSPWASQTWPQWSLWQYTDQGRVAGFPGSVDCNRFNGSDENFLKWMGPALAAAPAPAGTVTLTLSSSRPVTLIVVAGENVSLSAQADVS